MGGELVTSLGVAISSSQFFKKSAFQFSQGTRKHRIGTCWLCKMLDFFSPFTMNFV